MKEMRPTHLRRDRLELDLDLSENHWDRARENVVEGEVVRVLDDTLNLKRSVAALPDDARLLGGIPELDSMAVVSVIGSLEERFGVTFADDELDGSAFATVRSLVALVESKLAA